MHEDTRSAVIPESIIELWFFSELISPYEHRPKEGLYLRFWGLDRIHIDCIFSIVGSKLDDILLICDDICHLKLVHESFESIEGLSTLLTDLSRDHYFLSV